jgi:hypothetical protein
MSNGWTPERRARQAIAIQRWRPWSRSTGPKTTRGKAIVARNADKGGKRQKLRSEMRLIREALASQADQSMAEDSDMLSA